MMSTKTTRPELWLSLLWALLLIFGLSGCDGDDGNDGADGAPGAPASVDISNATELNAEITGASIQSPPVVTFRLTDGNGNPVKGLPASAVSFNLAKLIPGTNGNASAWQSYINREATATAPGAPGLGNTEIQATTENGSAGTLVFNESTATYTYTFATDVANVTTPIPVAYEPTLTHRITFEVRGFAPVDNPIYDFRPSDGATTGLFTRTIVDTDTCNLCHDDLALHGGARADTDECVACHNPGSVDPDSGNTVDMTVMIHKIHYGENLTNLPYQIWGFRNTLYDYSDVVHPQDVRNCSNCHNENNPITPDAQNWYLVPTAEACGACHDDVDFTTGANHAAGPATNDTCVGCHANPTALPGLEVRAVHSEPGDIRTASANYQLNIISITGGTPGTAPVATVSVTDPTTADPSDPTDLGTPYDLTTDPVVSNTGSRLRMTVAWNTDDYTNEGAVVPAGETNAGTAIEEAQVARTLLVENGVLGPNVVDNTDGTYNVTLGVVPGGTEGSGAATIEGRLTDPTLGRLAINSVVDFFPITDTSAQARRDIVSIIGCDRCHDVIEFHGSNRVNNDQVCVTCHNPNATDIDDRDDTVAGTCTAATYPDGKCEQSIDFKYMIHGIHANNIALGGGAYFDIRYPQGVSNCVACHESGTYYPDGDGPNLGSTIQSVVDYGVAPPVDRTTGDDNIRITPWASVCASCHVPDAERDDTASTNAAKLHMIQNGANFQQASGDPNQEVCAICHGPGKLADVGVVHGVAD
jgi:OmcA/MtrC family decaheme c-type cytochrome